MLFHNGGLTRRLRADVPAPFFTIGIQGPKPLEEGPMSILIAIRGLPLLTSPSVPLN